MRLEKEKLNSALSLYYLSEPDRGLIEKVINFWLEGKDGSAFNEVRVNKGRWVYKIKLSDSEYYIKKYFYRRFAKRFKNIFRSQPAIRSFKKYIKMRKRGIETIKPVAVLIKKRDFCLYDSVLITEGFSGSNLEDYFAENNVNYYIKQQIVNGLAELWGELLQNNYFLGDPSASNFLVDDRDEKNIVLTLVDMDNIRRYPILPQRYAVSRIVKFNALVYVNMLDAAMDTVSFRDRIKFLYRLLDLYEIDMSVRELADYIYHKTLDKLERWGKTGIINLIENENNK